jgi:hypothetical protein
MSTGFRDRAHIGRTMPDAAASRRPTWSAGRASAADALGPGRHGGRQRDRRSITPMPYAGSISRSPALSPRPLSPSLALPNAAAGSVRACRSSHSSARARRDSVVSPSRLCASAMALDAYRARGSTVGEPWPIGRSRRPRRAVRGESAAVTRRVTKASPAGRKSQPSGWVSSPSSGSQRPALVS